MKAKLTISQDLVLQMIKKSQPNLANLKVVVTRGYDDRYSTTTPDTFSIEAEVDVAVPILDGGK